VPVDRVHEDAIKVRKIFISSAYCHGALRQLLKQSPSLFEVGGIETFCEPTANRREETRRPGAVASSSPQPSQIGGGAQFGRASCARDTSNAFE